MLIGVAGGEEGEEDLVVPAEILGDQRDAALDIVEDRAMMLHHAARRAAGAGGVDDAGEIAAPEIGPGGAGLAVWRLAGDQAGPIVALDQALLPAGSDSIAMTCSQPVVRIAAGSRFRHSFRVETIAARAPLSSRICWWSRSVLVV
jgi:hypothetical protein